MLGLKLNHVSKRGQSKLNQCSATTKHNKARPVCVCLAMWIMYTHESILWHRLQDKLHASAVPQEDKTPNPLYQRKFSNRIPCFNRKSIGWEKPRPLLADAETSGPPTGQYVLSRAVFRQHAVGPQAIKKSDIWRFDMMCSRGYWICKHVIWQL